MTKIIEKEHIWYEVVNILVHHSLGFPDGSGVVLDALGEIDLDDVPPPIPKHLLLQKEIQCIQDSIFKLSARKHELQMELLKWEERK